MVTASEPSRRATEGGGRGGDQVQGHVAARDDPWVEAVDPATRARMARQRRRDTAPEVALRRELHRRGLRFRVDHPLEGMRRRRGDVVFTRARLAVFVDGCFWHDCPEHGTRPVSRAEWWADKLAKNVERDRGTDAWLASIGWVVIRIWEHEDPIEAASRVEAEYRSLVTAR
ncbi:very short patch repair endonuclease [Brachybacterium alimentarium]|uniref:very short patch repair endonuclease n=1 Tax=Brachybacterium alimentarium TaxID=47845 RepID=UPI003FD46673